MGAVIGSEQFKEEYVTNKIKKWIDDVSELSRIARDEPQLVYSSFTKAICHRWTYVQRTIPDIEHHFAPLEEAIRDQLIPALIGRTVSDLERRILALPVRHGGMGISDPTKSTQQYLSSTEITQSLTRVIFNQEKDFSNYDAEAVKDIIKEVKQRREAAWEEEVKEISEQADAKLNRVMELGREKGSGAWLNALPLQSAG